MSPVGLDPAQRRPPLGIGRIAQEALAIAIAHVGTISVLVFVPILLFTLVEFLLGIGEYATDPTSFFENGTIVWNEIFVWMFTNTVGVTIYAFLVRYAYDVKIGNPAGMGRSVTAVFRVFVPLAICDFLTTLVALLALFALILPGLYLLALWCVLVPVIVVEETGFQCFNRSAFLTADYRWPCVGIVAVILALIIGVDFAASYPINSLLASDNSWGVAAGIVVDALETCVSTTVSAVLFTLIYLRLRDIKEGTAWLADVFD